MRRTTRLSRPGSRGRRDWTVGGAGPARVGPAGRGALPRDWWTPQPIVVAPGPVAAEGGAELRTPPRRHGPIAAARGWRGDAAAKLVVVRGAAAVGEAAAGPGRLQREVAVPEGWERPGAAANRCAVPRETRLRRGLRPDRQRPHSAPAGGAELWRLQSIASSRGKPTPKEGESRTGSPSQPWRPGPGSGSSGLPGKRSDCGLVVIPETKLWHLKPLGKFITRPLLAPALHTACSGDLTGRPGHFRRLGRKGG